MNLNLNPQAFEKPLSFIWFSSSEFKTLDHSLDRALSALQRDGTNTEVIRAKVIQTLARVGVSRFKRHFEIRPIARVKQQGLIEFRWRFEVEGEELNLRLYSALSIEDAEIIGLFFGLKDIRGSKRTIRRLQNQQIDKAMDLFREFQTTQGSRSRKGS